MTDLQAPEWIKQLKVEQDQERKTTERVAERALLREKAIVSDGPAFWKRLLKELQRTIDGLPPIGITGTLTPINVSTEEAYEVGLTRVAETPTQVQTKVFYKAGNRMIRSHSSDRSYSELAFTLGENNELMVVGVDGAMPAEQVAQQIIEPMVRRLLKNGTR